MLGITTSVKSPVSVPKIGPLFHSCDCSWKAQPQLNPEEVTSAGAPWMAMDHQMWKIYIILQPGI